MKTLRILGFVLAMGLLAPLAQAAPVHETPQKLAQADAPPPAALDEDHTGPRADPGDSALPPSGDAWHGANRPTGPVYDDDSTPAPAVDDSPAPAVYPDTDSTPAYDAAPQETGDADSDYIPAHYTMDALVNAMQDLDTSY
jgi:hypothetical protein